ncbi:MAG: Fur family transcriptional regulator [Chloroflexota bacterium]|nr:Fur family transcriptional regulator [Chloroflexota bacterium]MDE2942006.1 Fur family transcriptional regulator [Chloroflexota bacterium]MDE3267104.1 Fur family transcriptional regulator [Chloroflexota bacterium]
MDVEKVPTSLMASLQSLGYKATAPRKAIADLLEQKHQGFTAEALSEELPSVSRATVYRNIKLFIEAGVVCRLTLMDGSHVYSVSRTDHHHHHYVCMDCGKVEEFRASAVEQFVRSIAAELPGQVVDHRIELYVACDRCPAEQAG